MKKAMKVIAIVALLSIVAIVCFACVPGDVEKAKAKMEKAGYAAESYSDKSAEDCDGAFTAIKSLIPLNGLYAFHFKTTKAAKEYYDSFTDGEKYEDVEISGKWVIFGSKEAIKVFKK